MCDIFTQYVGTGSRGTTYNFDDNNPTVNAN